MPHCIIEYSEDLNGRVNEIIEAVYSGAVNSGLFDSGDIKVRAIAYQHFHIGVANASFIHVSSRILSGRNSSQKCTLNSAITSAINTLTLTQCVITAEVIDIHKKSYAKLDIASN